MKATDILRSFAFIAIFAVAISCRSNQRIAVRLDHTRKTPIKGLYETRTITPLCIPDSLCSLAPSSKIKLDVSGEKVFVLDNTAEGILVFSLDGTFTTRITDCGHIVDFSTFDGRTLEVLSDTGDLISYSLNDLSLVTRYHPDNTKGVRLCAMHRFDDELYVMSGYTDGMNCFCEYYVKNNMFHTIREESEEICRFFDHKGTTYLLYPHSGEIWEDTYVTYYSTGEKVGPFVHPVFRWDFGEFDEAVGDARLYFDNAQMSDKYLFLSFILDGRRRMLILDTNTRKARTIESTKKHILFPLGIIRDNVNYFCCTDTNLPDYCQSLEKGKCDNTPGLYLLTYSIR